jgi:hypothetical protein
MEPMAGRWMEEATTTTSIQQVFNKYSTSIQQVFNKQYSTSSIQQAVFNKQYSTSSIQQEG